jgi:GH15 family glucan-1,4-alpha-glucosidase
VKRIRDSAGFAAIRDYGLIGDGHGSGLVCCDGSIDWLAVPAIDTAPFISGLLDPDNGGRFRVAPKAEFEVERKYLEGTMLLETSFTTSTGTLRVTDCMNQGIENRLPWSEVARVIEAVEGEVEFEWELTPGDGLATTKPFVENRSGVPFLMAGDLLGTVVTKGAGEVETTATTLRGEAVLHRGDEALVALVIGKNKPLWRPKPDAVRFRLEHTKRLWSDWSGTVSYGGRHRDEVLRSALTIKALQAADTGALAAAPTTSLPEVIGGSRNFDYRYAWVRDASFMIDALSRLSMHEEVDASLAWLLRGVQRTAPDVHVFYLLDGQPAPADQHENDLVVGYKGSGPVMVGNKAARQTQHGCYGDLLSAVARHVRSGAHLDTQSGLLIAQLADRLCDEWPKPDAGLWELPDYEVYTSSLIGCWTAFDRAVELARRGEIPSLNLERWQQAARDVRQYADDHCWSEHKSAYTFHAGTEDLDAAVLLAARTGFIPAEDRRLLTTIEAIQRELTAEDPWVFRYSAARTKEHTFVACTFWLIEALAIAGQEREAARLLEAALKGSNDLGLFSEELDAGDGSLLGNFPIGISHLAVIGAATAVENAG